MAATKPIKAKIKFRVPAGKATPAPPVGSSLGQHGVNMMEFINPFNEATKGLGDQLLSVKVTIFEDRSFEYTFKGESAAMLVRKAAGVDKGSGVPNKDKVGKLSKAQVSEIAATKIPEMNANNPEAAFKTIAGTARSMGITVED